MNQKNGSTRTKAVVITTIVVICLFGVGAWLVWPRGTTKVDEDKALENFRDKTTMSVADTTASTGETGQVPAAGVYSYSGSGEETVKFGPVPEERHPIPETVTAVVVDQSGGCFEYTLNLFAEHTEDTIYCTSPGGMSIDSYQKRQKIGALSTTVNISCDPKQLISQGTDSNDLNCSLDLAGAPVPVKAEFPATATTGAPEQRTVDGQQQDVVPLTVTYDITGSVSGTWTEKLWLNDDHLPVAVERTFDLGGGPVQFHERFTLELKTLSPST